MDKRRRSEVTSQVANENPPDQPDLEEDEDEEELAPCVVLGRLRDLDTRSDPTLTTLCKKYGERPIWFLIEEDADLVELFVRHPERPLTARTTQDILGALRTFATNHSDALQEVLGPTDAIGFGFHESASLDDVLTSFEDDGFDVALALRNGKIELEDEE